MGKPTRFCAGCGVELPPKVGRGNPRKWCSEVCRVNAWRAKSGDKVKAQGKRSTKKLEASKPPRPKCESCGAEMKRRAGNRFCGKPECRHAAYKAKSLIAPRCSEDGCVRPALGRGLCGPHYSAVWRSENPERAREVASKSRHARRTKLRDSFVEDVGVDYLLERDGWVCGICKKRIPKGAVYPDPLSPSLDHIVPVSQGGRHEKKNAQAAHFMCNATKSDTGYGDQLMLLG